MKDLATVILTLVALGSGGCSLLFAGDMLINGDPMGLVAVTILGFALCFLSLLGLDALRKSWAGFRMKPVLAHHTRKPRPELRHRMAWAWHRTQARPDTAADLPGARMLRAPRLIPAKAATCPAPLQELSA